jgi:U3 small nucleolar RNA-associated protein 6
MRMQDTPSFGVVHSGLLACCASLLKHVSSPAARLALFHRLMSCYLLAADTLGTFFASEASRSDEIGRTSDEVLKEIYHAWRRVDVVDASLAWAGWLLFEGKGREAGDVIQRARIEVDGASRQRLEDQWRRAVDDSTKRPEPESLSDPEEAMDQD